MSKKFGFIFLVVAALFVMTTVASAAGAKTNVNQTGNMGTGTNGSMSKAIEGHRVHGNYQNNTNSCASCHQTHTATSSANLLFKADASATCEACHEGQLGIYNVEDNVDLGSGSFDATAHSASVHNVDGTKQISAAPGARPDKVTGGNAWTAPFECVGCHNPHGSYSDRLLTVNPYDATSEKADVSRQYWNVYANSDPTKASTGTATGNVWDTSKDTLTGSGVKVQIPLVGSYATPVASSDSVKGLVAADTKFNDPFTNKLPMGVVNVNGHDIAFAVIKLTTADVAAGAYWDKAKTGLDADAVIVQAYRFVGNTWQPVPILTGANRTANVWVDTLQVVSQSAYDASTDAAKATKLLPVTTLNNIKGYFVPNATFTAVTKAAMPMIVKIKQAPSGNAITVNGVVEMKDDLAATYTGSNGDNIAYSEWCGSCHTDYFATSKVATGVDSDMYHHTVSSASNGRSCGYCHFAHGTNTELMKDALGKTVADIKALGSGKYPDGKGGFITWATDEEFVTVSEKYMEDVNSSSALKRFTNMTVCYGCHASSHYGALGNNGTTGAGAPTGLGAGITGNTYTW